MPDQAGAGTPADGWPETVKKSPTKKRGSK
jgi:hypothetical protein